MSVLVAVVTYNSSAVLPGLLAGLPAAMADPVTGRVEHGWRLVIVDNASTDGTLDLARRLTVGLPATVVSSGGNLGYAAGINLAAGHARCDDALLVLNADVRLARGAVPALATACAADPTIGVAVPVVTDENGVLEPTMRRRPTAARAWGEALLGARAGGLGERLPAGAHEAWWANGAVLFVPAPVRQRVGPWREDLFLYSEEVDYCRRVLDTGRRIVRVPGASAVHKGGDVGTAPRLWAQMCTNKVVHAARWEGRRDAVGTWAALIVGNSLRLPLRRGTHRAALAALWSGRRQLLAGIPVHPAAGAEFHQHLSTMRRPANPDTASVTKDYGLLPRPVKTWLRRHAGRYVIGELWWRIRFAGSRRAARRAEAVEVALARPDRVPTARIVVVIPTYRREERLRAAVASALAQSVSDIAVVVVDDGGGQTTGLPDDPRLTVIRLTANHGSPGLARNVGLRCSRSEYVAFLDDDNTWRPHHLAHALEALEHAELSYSAIRRHRADGSRWDVLGRGFDRRAHRDEAWVDINSVVLRRGPTTRFDPWARPTWVHPREDWEFVHRMSRRRRVRFSPEVTVDYLIHEDSYFTAWDAKALTG